MPNRTDIDFQYSFLDPLREKPLNTVVEPPTTTSADDPLNLLQQTRPNQSATGQARLSNVFGHQDAHPVVLDLLMTRQYGPEWLGWEGETIEHRVPLDFHSNISVLNLSKLQAMRTMHMVDSFWQRWEIFCWCLMPLNGVFPDFEIMQVPTVAQCMVAVDIANRTRDDMLWDAEIKAYLEVVHRHDEILVPQSPLDFVTVDTVGYPIDVAAIRKRWPEVRVNPTKAVGGDTVEDEQLRRMLDVYDVLEQSRRQLHQQLREVLNA